MIAAIAFQSTDDCVVVSGSGSVEWDVGLTPNRPTPSQSSVAPRALVVAPGGEKVDLVTHQGEAIGYLVSGTLELTIDDTTYLMTAADSFFFKAYLTHS